MHHDRPPSLPRDVSLHARASAPRRCPQPGPPPGPPQIPTRPLTSPHTRREFGPKCSARFDQPSPKAEVGELLQVQPQRRAPPARGVNSFGETRAGTAGGRKGPSGVPPRRGSGPPGNSLNFQGGVVHHRPPAPNAVRARGGSSRGARAAEPPSASPRHRSDPGPALGAPRPHHRGRLAPPRPPRATTQSRLPAPHPHCRRAPGTPAPGQPDAAQPCRPRSPGRAAPRPSAPKPLPGPLAETPPPLAPPASRTAPRQRGPHRVSGAAGERTHAAAPASHQRSAPPGAASFSPGLAGTSAHGSPHRGYF
ncbi:basic proline-rich protein-like [Meles meles]|uniref:basic proline-rich protein-like n=1 Tax=Meles meles TaxID=9662 RepID=UPI001E69881C|nr:basic proline-rich protein-like [Meles meles]